MEKGRSNLQIPNVDREYVERPVDMLLVSFKERVIILNAGAGYGKTQVLANYVHQCADRSAWYSLSETDNDLMSFIRNFTKSVQHALETGPDDFQVSVSQTEDLDILMERLVVWLDARIESLNIVLDDFQEIHNPDIFNLLDVLIETMLEKIRFFVVEKRSLPSFLEDYVKRQTAVCIGTEDLKFGQQEIEILLENKNILEADKRKQATEMIYSCTEGWLAGIAQILLQLSQQRKKGTVDAAAVKNICEKLEVSDYFMARVYRMLPYDIQMFLKKTAVLDYMTAPVCNQIMGIYNADSLLKYLENEKLFVQSMGGARGLYRYHSIFRRFLLSQISAREQMESLRKAAYFFMKSHDKIQAAEYGCRGKITDVVMAVMEASGEEILKERLYDTLKRWFAFLQEQNCELTPKARFVYGRYLWALGLTKEAREQIKAAGKAFYQEGKLKDYKKVLLFMAAAERKAGNLKQTEICLKQAEMEREKYWNDIAEAVCTERVKYECCLHRLPNAARAVSGWAEQGIPLKENTFLFAAERLLCSRDKMIGSALQFTGIEDSFLLQNCILAEDLKQAYQEADYQRVLKDASEIIENAPYDTLQTAIARKMLAVLAWEDRNYRKAVEQARLGDNFLYRNQIGLQSFTQKHEQILNEIGFLKKNTVDTRYCLSRKEEADKQPDKAKTAKIQIQCLKRFCVTVSGAGAGEVKWRTKKAQELFAYLFHLQGNGVSREGLIALLWPETGAKSATALFHTTLYSIRQAFAQEGGDELIVYENKKYFLNMQMVSSDLEKLLKYFRDTKSNKSSPEQVIQLYFGGYMENTGYLWSYATAKKLEDECLRVCRKGAEERMLEKKEVLAIPFLERILEIEPYDDEAASSLVVCLYKIGKRAEARQYYNRLVKIFKEDLEVEFEKTFQELVER